ncbi:MAG: hypothetical protein D6741_01955 [Planctomycetota bacterium]|nr:MAG: hypothetical protein D6741_01955 [Planctomycetota bacterium]
MPIEVVCSNGHVLRVKDSLAGKTGLCPVCRVRVRVPAPANDLSEAEILDILSSGPKEPEKDVEYHPAEEVPPTPPKKICRKCQREILAATHICPYCRTYIAGLSDFLTK